MSSKKPTRTRDQYKAHLQRRKAEKLVEAVQRVAETYDARPLRTLCSRMKSQENTRIKRAKLGKKADAVSLLWRNPLDLSAGYGITALHVACQLFANMVKVGNAAGIAAMEDAVAALMRPSKPVPVKNELGIVVDIVVRPGATPTLVMKDPRHGQFTCIELCPRKPQSSERRVPKALSEFFANVVENESGSRVVDVAIHKGAQQAYIASRKLLSFIPKNKPEGDYSSRSVWESSAVSGRAMEPCFAY